MNTPSLKLIRWSDSWRSSKTLEVGPEDIVAAFERTPTLGQVLQRALRIAQPPWTLFRSSAEGNLAEAKLSSIVKIQTRITLAGQDLCIPREAIEANFGNPWRALPPRADAIVLELTKLDPDGSQEILDLPTDLAFAENPNANGWEEAIASIVPIIQKDSALKPRRLLKILRKSLFDYGDDGIELEEDSWPTQLRQFDDLALHLALRTLKDDAAATRKVMNRILRRDASWAIPPGRRFTLRVHPEEGDAHAA